MFGIKKIIRDFEPEIIGVGLRNIDTCDIYNYNSFVNPFIKLVSELKRMSPKSPIVAGGPAFSYYAQPLMERTPAIDYGVFLEGEETLPELLDNLERPGIVKGIYYRNNGVIHFTGYREHLDFTHSVTPRRDIIDLTPYLRNPFSIGVQTKRGCVFRCAYCNYPFLQGNEFRIRPAQAVVDELEELKIRYGIHDFHFVDSIFNVPKNYTREILQGMITRGLNLQWRGFDHLKYYDAEYIKLAKESGCACFEMSPDGLSHSSLAALNKDITRKEIERAYSMLRRTDNIKFCFNFFINGPGESVTNLLHLAYFLIRSKLILRTKIAYYRINYVRVYPNTPIQAMAIKKGYIKEDNDLIQPFFYNPPPLKYILPVFTPIWGVVSSMLKWTVGAWRKTKIEFEKKFISWPVKTLNSMRDFVHFF